MEKHEHVHKSRPDVLNRLARIEGHVRGVKKMVEEDKECEDVLLQISAVQAALKKVYQIILKDHLENCLISAVKDGNDNNALDKLTKAIEKIISN